MTSKEYYQLNKEKISIRGKTYYKYHADYQRKLRAERKKQVYDFYGRVCNCCGETEELFLSIDHINNDGYIERKQTRGGHTSNIMRNIIKAGFPNTYQILCMNCNHAKARNGGVCPHELCQNQN